MSAPCPNIAIYQLSTVAGSGGVGKSPLWIAKYSDGGTLLSPTFEGATEAEAVKEARVFWADEQISLAKARAARREAA